MFGFGCLPLEEVLKMITFFLCALESAEIPCIPFNDNAYFLKVDWETLLRYLRLLAQWPAASAKMEIALSSDVKL